MFTNFGNRVNYKRRVICYLSAEKITKMQPRIYIVFLDHFYKTLPVNELSSGSHIDGNLRVVMETG